LTLEQTKKFQNKEQFDNTYTYTFLLITFYYIKKKDLKTGPLICGFSFS